MSLILPFERITAADRPRVGGKAYALSLMAKTGAAVPSGICITIDAYRQYVRLSGIAERIRMELSRKRFVDMRWEEVWDAALRIRNMFLTTPLSRRLYRDISGPCCSDLGIRQWWSGHLRLMRIQTERHLRVCMNPMSISVALRRFWSI